MFSFIFNHTVVIDEIVYGVCGIVCIYTGIIGLKNKKARIGTFLFWSILGILFMFGKVFVHGFKYGGAVIGGLLIFLGILALTKQVQMGEFKPIPKEEIDENSKKAGNKIFIPALLLGIAAMFLAQMKSFNISLGTNDAGKTIIFGFSTAQVVGLSSLIAFAAAIIITRPKPKTVLDDTAKILMQVGSANLLPQLLGVRHCTGGRSHSRRYYLLFGYGSFYDDNGKRFCSFYRYHYRRRHSVCYCTRR